MWVKGVSVIQATLLKERDYECRKCGGIEDEEEAGDTEDGAIPNKTSRKTTVSLHLLICY